MSANGSNNSGKIWGLAIGAGVLAFLVLRFMASYGFGPALLLAILIALLVAVLFWIGFYRDSEPESVSDTVAPPAPADAQKSARTYTPADAATASTAQAGDSAPKAEAAPETKPATAAAEKKPAKKSAAKKPAAKEVAPAKTTAKKPAAKKTAAKKPAAEKSAAAKATEKKSTATKPAPKAPAKKPVAKDGKPEFLSAPREGGADDLKMIKGVGPKLEKLLNSMGVYHFDQIAGWRAKEVKWVDENLEGVRGRVSRDEWVKQAKVLAKGGTTEFSKRVKKGGVY